ncbi:MAG TPA: diguanylate cyclase [Bryobacteraceae bacterium]|nr:diguanylate cyclase [Bryobacteraceae bacterium]
MQSQETAAARTAAHSSFDSPDQVDLQRKIERLSREIQDYQIELALSNEHGDILQEHLYRLSQSLTAEIRERQASEEKLQRVLNAIRQEKGDLEVLVQILIEQGDTAAEEGEKARIDGLTRIPNRRRFDEYLAREWERCASLSEPIALLLCDVDHFKAYNDFYGHQVGDECLRVVAHSIERCCADGSLVARYGGEEFAVILPGAGRERAMNKAESILGAVAAANVRHEKSSVSACVTVSIGVVCRVPVSARERDLRAFVDDADRNLYLAKRRGRNRAEY